MRNRLNLSPLLLAVCLVGALSLGSKASWGAPTARATQHEAVPGGGATKPADPDEFDVNKARHTTRAAGVWDRIDDHTWSDGFLHAWGDLNDLIQYIFGPKRPRHL